MKQIPLHGLFGYLARKETYHIFMPFLKVHVNPEGERCVVVHLDGEERTILIIDIAIKHFKIKAIGYRLKANKNRGHQTPRLVAKSPNRLVISLTVEELKLSTDLAKLSYNIFILCFVCYPLTRNSETFDCMLSFFLRNLK